MAHGASGPPPCPDCSKRIAPRTAPCAACLAHGDDLSTGIVACRGRYSFPIYLRNEHYQARVGKAVCWLIDVTVNEYDRRTK